MALNITAQGDAKLSIRGTSIEVGSVYGRLEINLPKNGMSMYIYNDIYESKVTYDTGSNNVSISELSPGHYTLDVDVAMGEEQSLSLAHSKLQSVLEADGYDVTIVDL